MVDHNSKSSTSELSMTNKACSDEIKAYFTDMEKPSDLSYSEYLHIAYDINALNRSEDKIKDCRINISDFLSDPRSLSQILRMTRSTKENVEKQLDLD